jgi:hypothetical protein
VNYSILPPLNVTQESNAIREIDLTSDLHSVRTVAGTGIYGTGVSAPAPALSGTVWGVRGFALMPNETTLFFIDNVGKKNC